MRRRRERDQVLGERREHGGRTGRLRPAVRRGLRPNRRDVEADGAGGEAPQEAADPGGASRRARHRGRRGGDRRRATPARSSWRARRVRSALVGPRSRSGRRRRRGERDGTGRAKPSAVVGVRRTPAGRPAPRAGPSGSGSTVDDLVDRRPEDVGDGRRIARRQPVGGIRLGRACSTPESASVHARVGPARAGRVPPRRPRRRARSDTQSREPSSRRPSTASGGRRLDERLVARFVGDRARGRPPGRRWCRARRLERRRRRGPRPAGHEEHDLAPPTRAARRPGSRRRSPVEAPGLDAVDARRASAGSRAGGRRRPGPRRSVLDTSRRGVSTLDHVPPAGRGAVLGTRPGRRPRSSPRRRTSSARSHVGSPAAASLPSDEEQLGVRARRPRSVASVSAVYDVPPRRISRSTASSPSTSPTAASTIASRSAAAVTCPVARLLPRIVGHHEQDDVEGEGVPDVHGGDEVPDVRRIEGAAEDARSGAPSLSQADSDRCHSREACWDSMSQRAGSRRTSLHDRPPPGPDPAEAPSSRGMPDRQPEVGIATMSDSVGLYLNEIGQVPLLNAAGGARALPDHRARPRRPSPHRRRRASPRSCGAPCATPPPPRTASSGPTSASS